MPASYVAKFKQNAVRGTGFSKLMGGYSHQHGCQQKSTSAFTWPKQGVLQVRSWGSRLMYQALKKRFLYEI